MINLENAYAKVNNLYFAKKYFGNELYDDEKIIEINDNNITFKNEKVEEFYKRYKSEINSFKREYLHKIYDDLKLRVDYILTALDNSHKIIVRGTSIEYIDNLNKNNSKIIQSSEELIKMRELNLILDGKDTRHGNNLLRDYTFDSADISFISVVDKVECDEKGFYIVYGDNKEYLYIFS